MKKVLLHACIVSLVSLTACGGNTPVQDPNNVSLAAPVPTPAVAIDTTKPSAAPTSQAAALPTLPAQSQSSAAKSMGALNPEHGKPGHRCDIAVGAPLSSPVQKPQQSAQPAQVLPAQPLPAQPLPAANGGVVRLNPAHGQPGHDCAVQVGQPLKN